MSCTLALHRAPLPALWGLPTPTAGMRVLGLDWAPLDPDGDPPQRVRAVIVAAALRLGRLAFLGDPPPAGRLRMPWAQPEPTLTVTEDALVGQALFDSAASWGQQGQVAAVLGPGDVPTLASLEQAAPARAGAVAALFACPSVVLVMLPAVDGAAIGVYARGDAHGDALTQAWECALERYAQNAGLPLQGR